MNRTDRLYALVEELRARAPRSMTAADLSRRFEVSIRTIERDVLALQEAGVPIWSQPGPGGGYTIDPSRTLPPLNFTAEEATAIAVALATTGKSPFAASGRSALRKLVSAMSESDSAAHAELAKRIHVRPSRHRHGESDVLAAIEQAVVQGRVVRIGYTDRDGNITKRDVEAHALTGGAGAWYLVGWCRSRDDARTFRLSRIQSAAVTTEAIPERDIDAWGRPVIDLLEEETLDKQDVLSRLESDRAQWVASLALVPATRFDDDRVTGSWSAKDVLNHVSAYVRFYLFQAKWAVDGLPVDQETLSGGRAWADDGGDYQRRNEQLTIAGKHLSAQQLLDEEAFLFDSAMSFVRSLTPVQLTEEIGWMPTWDPSFVAPDDNELLIVRRVADVRGLVQVTTVGEWFSGLYHHAIEHARDIERTFAPAGV